MRSIKRIDSTRMGTSAILRPMSIVSLCCVALVYSASYSSGIYNEYVYNYEVSVISGPSGFRFTAKASLDVLYATKATDNKQLLENEIDQGGQLAQASDSLLVRVKLTDPIFYPGPGDHNAQPLTINSKYNKLYNPDHNLYAHIVTLANGTALVREIYTHQSDATTFKNIKKAILLNILPTNHHLKVPPTSQNSLGEQSEYISVRPLDEAASLFARHDNSEHQPELFSPDSISQVRIVAKTRSSLSVESTTASNAKNRQIKLPTVFQTVDGQQNVTFRSRVLTRAESNLTTNFSLELVDQIKSNAHEKFDQADSMAAAIELLDDRHKYNPDSIQLERERKICSTHHCGMSLGNLFQNYRDFLRDESMASVEAAVTFLRILDRLRRADGTSANEILNLLKKCRGNQGIESSLLDILAAARTKDSISAALKHLKLPKSDKLDVAERFLATLSVAAKTAAKMHLKRPLQSPYYYTPIESLRRGQAARELETRLASLEFIAHEFLDMLEQVPAHKWLSEKLRQSSLLTLAILVSANNQDHNYENTNDELNLRVEQILLNELNACKPDDTECRIVAMLAIGNAGRLGDAQFQVLKDQVLEFGKRESNTAMRVLRDLLSNQAKDKFLGQNFHKNLKKFLVRIVYDSSQETTSRVLAAEMIVRFVPNLLVAQEILNNLPYFVNNELATMIYSRMHSLMPSGLAKHHENWYWKSNIISGKSASFVKTMARTESLNASYGVNVELLDKGKIFKESSFDVFLDTKQRTQDLFSLGIFARGMAKFAKDSDEDAAGAADETMTAGMTLRLMGGYLRPYIFFTGWGEVLGHYWRGTASKPTTIFNGDLLLIDHQEGYPLVSGFVAEQQMRGVLSIDVSGQVQLGLTLSKEAHSVVTTKASIIVQASQAVYTSYDHLLQNDMISFGGQASIDFVADAFFNEMPAQTCLQVSQPHFTVRLNSRRHEQKMTKGVSRKLARRAHSIFGKSYSLNSENNKMCSAIHGEL